MQERWLKADVALIKAELADRHGNLTYRKAARNFSPLMAAAATLTIVQASCVVAPGAIEAEQVITPGIFVNRIIEVPDAQQEEALLRAGGDLLMSDKLSNAQIAWRAAQDIAHGAYVNLGIGFPEMVAKFHPQGRQAIFHTENGILDFGEASAEGAEDWDLINDGKKAVTLKPGAAFFHHADSFAMVRGGHLDIAILGAYEVAETGDLDNWSTGPKGVPAVMDLVHGAKRVAVITDHVTKDGRKRPFWRLEPVPWRRRGFLPWLAAKGSRTAYRYLHWQRHKPLRHGRYVFERGCGGNSRQSSRKPSQRCSDLV